MGRRIQPWHRLPLAWLVLATLVGRYRVTLDHDLGIDRGFSPTHEVDIRPGRTTELDFDIDTGIR
jgi:hypothetical protein